MKFIEYLRVNYPYVWQSKVHFFLPYYLLIFFTDLVDLFVLKKIFLIFYLFGFIWFYLDFLSPKSFASLRYAKKITLLRSFFIYLFFMTAICMSAKNMFVEVVYDKRDFYSNLNAERFIHFFNNYFLYKEISELKSALELCSYENSKYDDGILNVLKKYGYYIGSKTDKYYSSELKKICKEFGVNTNLPHVSIYKKDSHNDNLFEFIMKLESNYFLKMQAISYLLNIKLYCLSLLLTWILIINEVTGKLEDDILIPLLLSLIYGILITIIFSHQITEIILSNNSRFIIFILISMIFLKRKLFYKRDVENIIFITIFLICTPIILFLGSIFFDNELTTETVNRFFLAITLSTIVLFMAAYRIKEADLFPKRN